MLKFVFQGEPKAVQSARFYKAGDFIRSYQPKDVRDWKSYIRLSALQQVERIGDFKAFNDGVAVSIDFVFSPLKSWPKCKIKQLEDGVRFYKTTRPDLSDNLMKGLIDALTGLIWHDDAQIVRIDSRKYYGPTPQIVLVAWDYNEDANGQKAIKEEEIF